MKTLDEITVLLREHSDELCEKHKVREIAIFGSYVRGEANEGSDVDILIDFSELVGLLELSALRLDLIDLLGLEVDVVPKADIRKELRDAILCEAITVWHAA